MTAAEQLDAIRARVRGAHRRAAADLREHPSRSSPPRAIAILDYDDVPEHHDDAAPAVPRRDLPGAHAARGRPRAPVPVHLAPSASRSPSGCATPRPASSGSRGSRSRRSCPAWSQVEPDQFVLLDQVIEANLDELFRGMEILETHLFRVTRDADIAIEEDEADDLLLAIEEEVRRRRFGEAVRLEVERSMPEVTRQILMQGRRRARRGRVRGRRDARPHRPVAARRPRPARPQGAAVHAGHPAAADARTTTDEPVDLFAQIRAGDILVHHPYESFTASVERFIAQAADDPDVLTIKQTLYRTSGDSPIVQSADPRGGARQAGRGPGRDQGALRRGGQHRLGPAPRAGGRPRRLRPRRPQDPLEGGAGRAPRGHRAAPLRPHRDRQLQLEDRAARTWTSGSCRAARSSARTSRTCSTR